MRQHFDDTASPELEVARSLGETSWRGPYAFIRVSNPGPRASPEQKRRIMEMIERESVPMMEGVDIRESYWRRRPDYLDRLSEWTIAEHRGRLVAWCGVCRWRAPMGRVLYVDTLAVMPGHRRAGLGALLVFEAWCRWWGGRGSMPAISLRTQSPVVYAMLHRFVPAITFPQLARLCVTPPPRAVDAATYTVAQTSPGKEFDPTTGVVRKALDAAGSLYGRELPFSGNACIDDFFARGMDVGAGDSLIAVVLWNWRTLVRAALAYGFVLSQLGRRLSPSELKLPSPDQKAAGA